MAIRNPLSITYGGLAVGGNSDIYLIDGPWVLDLAYETVRASFDVVVVGTSHSDLVTKSAALEAAYSKRDSSLVVSLNGAGSTYSSGTSLLNSSATCTKTGDPQRDRGFSRAYTCTVTGEQPSTDTSGLRDLETNLTYEPSRQRIVTMRGVYTTIGGSGARATYTSGFDSVASSILDAIDNGASWELVSEDVSNDRNDHLAQFTRQYVELLANQVEGTLDAAFIRDHNLAFTDTGQYPGDALEGVARLRRVVASYAAAVDINESVGAGSAGDLTAAWEDNIRAYLISQFQTNYSPSEWCIEEERIALDWTRSMVSATMQFLYRQSSRNPNGKAVVEVVQSLAYREVRTVDQTPTHSGGEYDAYVDAGWAVRERIWTRSVVSIGADAPRRRIGSKDDASGLPSGKFDHAIEGVQVSLDDTIIHGVRSGTGWNITSNTSSVSDRWVGDPTRGEEQILLSALTETIVERYHKRPRGRTVSGGFFNVGGELL